MDDPIPDFKLDYCYRPSEQYNVAFDSLMATQEDGRNYITMFKFTLANTHVHEVREKALENLERVLRISGGTASIPSPCIRYVLIVQTGAEATCEFPKEWIDRWGDILNVYALEMDL